MAVADKTPITGLIALNTEEVLGINDRAQLAHLERYYQRRLAENLMLNGVTLQDPNRFDLRGNLLVDSDVCIDINVVIEGVVKLGVNTKIGPNCWLKNVTLGNNVQVLANCVLDDCTVEDNCIIGPFARIRPKSSIKNGAHIGNFVELKNCKLGKNSKANHLSYLGDCTIGNNVNIGAGTITCNYDGANKYHTTIDDGVFVGSDVQFIAPVKIGKDATIGAGSTITEDVPKGKLVIARARQVVIKKWQRPKK
jgi:bifunctional UDP-N-acetylglucosamine pyrophosphorylase / glucosamine-1-phosphate N-acetyltransferase